jgi:hypothetical protein
VDDGVELPGLVDDGLDRLAGWPADSWDWTSSSVTRRSVPSRRAAASRSAAWVAFRLATAMAFHERLGAAPWVARTHVERARLLLATGSHDRALGLLADAGKITRRCGMSSLAADISSRTAPHPEAATTPAFPCR